MQDDDRGSNSSREASIGELIERRLGRREALQGLAGIAALSAAPAWAQSGGPSSLTFNEIGHRLDEQQHVPDGYEAQIVVRWGDPVLPGAPEFDAMNQAASAQELQFGYNNDYLGLYPLPADSGGNDRFLLVVNHEYTSAALMFPGGRGGGANATRAQAEVEMAAHGGSVLEIALDNGRWKPVQGSKYARRLTAHTPMQISGPAAGHDKMRTSADPAGRTVLGMLNNCAGGNTPWGTWLTCEENFDVYFGGDATKHPDAASLKRYGFRRSRQAWSRYVDRFDLAKEPNEPNRFGWVVEIDPYDPASIPVKRTALGRFKHEGCTYALCRDGRVAFYSGDDERFDYVYKFVTSRPWNPSDRAANKDLLDEGTLHVARFSDDGKVEWLPLVQGQGPLTPENGFASQADVVINTRLAADLLKATPMDRPEDVEASPTTGKVYVVMTNNGSRRPDQISAANPRARNDHGHIVEIVPKDGDHASADGTWSIFLLAGKPGQDAGARYHRATSASGWLSCPDNVAFDSKGRLWISTDGGPVAAGVADGVWGCDTEGYGRALTRLFYQSPAGAEVCGPIFTPDDRALFLAIQHPGELRGSTFDRPVTRWPDFKDGMPPRPSVIAIVRKDGGTIGS
ncbi:MAG: PhoX family phosphatase [Enhydrobacter sp.]|nr:MAG: PhoX family phosphatase [Enhydrobacter sp.]